jgi:hypothetical protein
MRMSKLFNLTGELLIESKLLTQPLYDGVSATLFMSGEINDRPEIFWSRGWKWAPTAGFGPVSNGGSPPQGLMPLFPTAVILAQNLAINLDMTNEKNSSSWSSIKTSASFGWGPFSISGNYGRSDSQSKSGYTQSNSGIKVPGPQIIAYICEVIPQSPNPDPKLDWPS